MNADSSPPLVILLVEDEEIVRTFTVRALKRQGHDVVIAANPAEAFVRSGERSRIDVLISDVVLPGMGGVELAHRFRTLHPEAAIILTSGHPGSEVLPVQPTDIEFLAKPFGTASLFEAIGRVTASRG